MHEHGESEQSEMEIDLDNREEEDDLQLCKKCAQMSKLLTSKENSCMSDILLNRKTIDNLLPYVCDNWSTAKKIQCLYDFRSMGTCEFTLFEHIILYKYWYKLITQSSKRKLHCDLYRDLLDKNQVHLVHSQRVESKVYSKLKEIPSIQEDMRKVKLEVFLFKEVLGLLGEEGLIQQNIAYNNQEKSKLQEFLKTKLKHHSLITNETILFYDKYQEAESFDQIANIYSSQIADSAKVNVLLQQLRLSPSFDHTQSQSFRKLDHDFALFISWEQKYTQMMKDSACELKSTKILKRLKEFKGRARESEEISQIQFEFMKSLFQNKIHITQAEQILKSAKSLFIQNEKEIQNLQT